MDKEECMMDDELLDGYGYTIELLAEKEALVWKVTGKVIDKRRYSDQGHWIQKEAVLSSSNSSLDDAINDVIINLSMFLSATDGDLFDANNLLQ